jgi:EmrB/QacA subfamily drug resistance transporter
MSTDYATGRVSHRDSQPTEPAEPAEPAYPRRRLAAAVMIVAVLMDLIDGTIVNIALPTIRQSLGASGTDLEWVVSGYFLSFAATLIIAGNLGDLFGRRRVFMIGIAAFGTASLCAGLAPDPGVLIAARIAQGAAAAAMTPQVLATFRSIFAAHERGTAFGVYGATAGFAVAIGLLLGGVLTSANLFGWSWRPIFFVNIPIAIVTLAASAMVVPETRGRATGRPDLRGAAVLAVALVAIVYPLLEGRRLGWPVWCWILVAGGVVALGLLGLRETRQRHAAVAPLLHTPLFRIPAITAGLVLQLTFSAGLQGFFLAFTLWLQIGEQYSPMRAGLTMIAFTVGSFVTAPAAIGLAQRYGRAVLALGSLLLAAGAIGVLIAADHLDGSHSPWTLTPGLFAAGAGLGLVVVPLVNVVLAAAPLRSAGGAAGLFSTAQQLGGAIGAAVMGAVFFSYLASHSYTSAFVHCAPIAAAAWLACGLLCLALPRTAVSEDAIAELA